MSFTIDGETYEDEFDYVFKQLPPLSQDKGVISPEKAQKQIEQGRDPNVIYDDSGAAVDYDFKRALEAPQMAPDALKSPEGTKPTPENDPSPRASNAVDWSKLNQPFGSIKSTSKEDTPVIFQDKTGLIRITEGDLKEAIDIGMGAATIGGAGSKTANQTNRFKASFALAKGEDPKEVLKQYGWFKDSSGRMKYEISDEAMKLKDKDWTYGETGKITDFIEHPELFEAYPHLKDLNFKVAEKGEKNLGSYSPSTNTLTINAEAIKGDEKILDVIAHELQHSIQAKEGFSGGSSPERAIQEVGEAILSKMRDAGPEQKRELIELYLDVQQRAKQFGEYMYLRNPGEVEANMVAARRKLTKEMREKFPVEEHKKLVEGELNTLHGGTYEPEFFYPKK